MPFPTAVLPHSLQTEMHSTHSRTFIECLLLLYALPQFNSVAQSCPTLCDPMDCSMPGLPLHYQLPESTQTHVHWVSDAIQPPHPLLSPFPPTLNLSLPPSIFPSITVFSNESVLHIRPVNIVWDVISITISQKQPALKRYFSDVSVCSQRCLSSSEVCFQSFVAQWILTF